jgi:hypothetical protein
MKTVTRGHAQSLSPERFSQSHHIDHWLIRSNVCWPTLNSVKGCFRVACPISPASSEPWCRKSTERTHLSVRPVNRASRVTLPLSSDIAETIRKYGIAADWTPTSLALYTHAVLQGPFILAKAREAPEVAAACLDHLAAI